MTKYRKRPVIVDALQWTGQNGKDIGDFADLGLVVSDVPLRISTMDGTHKVQVGDWIIKSAEGKLSVCPPDVFEQTYDITPTDELNPKVDVKAETGMEEMVKWIEEYPSVYKPSPEAIQAKLREWEISGGEKMTARRTTSFPQTTKFP